MSSKRDSDVSYWRGLLLDACEERPQLLPHAAVEGMRVAQYATAIGLPLAEAALCESAAFIHDIGKVGRLVGSGFHPLDGAAYVYEKGGSERLAGLVAHHSGALYEAEIRGMTIPYPREVSPVSRIIDVVDMTTTQEGLRVSLQERADDIHARYGPGSPQVRALERFWMELVESEGWIRDRAGTVY